MKPIKSYIIERLNPRHLDPKFNIYNLDGPATWSHEKTFPFVIVLGKRWYLYAWKDYNTNILLFWSPDTDWMPYLEYEEKPELDKLVWNFTSVYNKEDSRSPKDIKSNFHTWVRKNAGYKQVEKVNISMNVKNAVDEWIRVTF